MRCTLVHWFSLSADQTYSNVAHIKHLFVAYIYLGEHQSNSAYIYVRAFDAGSLNSICGRFYLFLSLIIKTLTVTIIILIMIMICYKTTMLYLFLNLQNVKKIGISRSLISVLGHPPPKTFIFKMALQLVSPGSIAFSQLQCPRHARAVLSFCVLQLLACRLSNPISLSLDPNSLFRRRP